MKHYVMCHPVVQCRDVFINNTMQTYCHWQNHHCTKCKISNENWFTSWHLFYSVHFRGQLKTIHITLHGTTKPIRLLPRSIFLQDSPPVRPQEARRARCYRPRAPLYNVGVHCMEPPVQSGGAGGGGSSYGSLRSQTMWSLTHETSMKYVH